MNPVWNIRLTRAAEDDFQHILRWTTTHFGRRQGKTYARTVTLALSDLSNGPDILGVKQREDIGLGIYTLHVARKGRRGSHFVVFRVSHSSATPTIDVLRILHEAMDLVRHLSESEN
ncbi:MAG: type II toxin-antitoxin system RelE/ParE family toxin [Desulfuromonas sp.]|nr:type II toxin-antitoxin system RelE/ParE family toxin [Desulfuromonas sp.]